MNKSEKPSSKEVIEKTKFSIKNLFAPLQESPINFRFYDIFAKIFCNINRETKITKVLPICVVISFIILSRIGGILVPITEEITDTAGLTNYKDLHIQWNWWMNNANLGYEQLLDLNAWLVEHGKVKVPDSHFAVENTLKKIRPILYWISLLLMVIFFRLQSKKARKYRKFIKDSELIE